MCEKGLELSRVFDVLGFRILVNDVSECYAALGVVHGLWEPILDEFDDYIAKPKPNGYQSLHSAVIGPDGVTIEVQIRTFAMHRHADLGVAAHWQYKEGLQRRIAWSRSFLGNGESAPRDIDIIERFKQAAFHDRIYVLTPQGHIIDLPADATPLDFAYAIHTQVGHRCRGAKVDGAMISLTKNLVSGQQVEILTARDGHPSRDWLNPNLGYLKTSSARAKVRRWLKQQDHEAHVAQGRLVLEREHRRLGLTEINIAELARRFKMRAEDLLAAVGRGDIGTARLGQALGVSLPPQAPSTAAASFSTASQGRLLVHGAGNVLTRVAGCCKPVPGEPIGGYVTAQGGGISIHRRDCPNLKQLAALRPQKLMEVAWGEESDKAHTGRGTERKADAD
jgi:GTP pyrophosphokinase